MKQIFPLTEPPGTLDPWRTALFIASMSEYSRLRVIGVDGQAGPLILASLEELEQNGWLSWFWGAGSHLPSRQSMKAMAGSIFTTTT